MRNQILLVLQAISGYFKPMIVKSQKTELLIITSAKFMAGLESNDRYRPLADVQFHLLKFRFLLNPFFQDYYFI